MATDAQANAPASFTFGDVFKNTLGFVGTLGGQYLTLKGQEKIAVETAKAQVRLNGYSAVNPSLGAVNPGAALKEAVKSPAQSWLPGGLPLTGTPNTVGQSGAVSFNWTQWVIPVLVVVGIVFLVRKLLK